jgi:hypothetical protein
LGAQLREKDMNRRHFHVGRLGGILLLATGAWAQPAPVTRILVVDGARAPVRSSARPMPAGDLYRNESAAIDTCLNYVDAQWIYFRSEGRADFAAKILSAPGLRDGLYWPLDGEGDESPMGPRFAAAAAAERDAADARPLYGYYFRVLAVDGPAKGFGLIAWPAQYGVTGARVLLVSHQGEVFAKDLGADSSRLAAAIRSFAPDRTWTRVASVSD